eukprot:3076255-Pyramimonas_sp.AAC.1
MQGQVPGAVGVELRGPRDGAQRAGINDHAYAGGANHALRDRGRQLSHPQDHAAHWCVTIK